jgi:hypothetical protein
VGFQRSEAINARAYGCCGYAWIIGLGIGDPQEGVRFGGVQQSFWLQPDFRHSFRQLMN